MYIYTFIIYICIYVLYIYIYIHAHIHTYTDRYTDKHIDMNLFIMYTRTQDMNFVYIYILICVQCVHIDRDRYIRHSLQ